MGEYMRLLPKKGTVNCLLRGQKLLTVAPPHSEGSDSALRDLCIKSRK